MPYKVPLGMDTLGFRKSPDILAPANMPAVAGKNTPNTLATVSFRLWSLLPAAPAVKFGHRFAFSDFNEMPVYIILKCGATMSEKGLTKRDERGIDREDKIRTTKRKFEAREKARDPTSEMIVTKSNIDEAYKKPHHPPCKSDSTSMNEGVYFW